MVKKINFYFLFVLVSLFLSCADQKNGLLKDVEGTSDDEVISENDVAKDHDAVFDNDLIEEDIVNDDSESDETVDEDVEPLFEVAIELPQNDVTEYGRASFFATVTGGIAPFVFEWDFDGASMPSGEESPQNIEFKTPGDFKISLTVKDSSGKTAEDEKMFTVLPLEGKMHHYFGNFHGHSGISDGEGTAVEIMNWAKFDEKIDFYVMTDHAEQVSESEWAEIKLQTDLFNEDGVFAAMRGFEWSHPVNGHICIYETDDYSAAYSDLWINKIYEWIKDNNGIAQFNHPGREIEAFNNLKLEPDVLSNMIMMETGNKSTGNNDGEFIPYFIKALDNGWQVAPTSNQDNHKMELTPHRSVFVGEELTRAHLLDAMKSRRIYSSDDPDIKIVFKHKEHWMGSNVTVTDPSVRFDIKVVDNEPVQKLELITNKGVSVAEFIPEEGAMTVFWFPEITVTQSSYYFLKVTSEDILDGEAPVQIALTAPIWIYR
ncbi:MAG TPA: CehA/McbA family metallohydrolase [bacterium]|nr:CehA/McbA family metallohydrolase [bacterium]